MTTPEPGKAPAPAEPKQEEEDLDELDDLLDQFTPAPAPVPPATTAGPSTSQKSSKTASNALPDDFEVALAREMEAMMRGAEGPAGPSSTKSTEEMAAAWQKLLIADLEGTKEPENLEDLLNPTGNPPPQPTTSPSTNDSFQQTIRQAMEKLKESHESARIGSEAESFAELLKQLGDMNAEAGEGEEGLQGMIESMMGQLMGKEILYEPLVELDQKFPAYFEEHPGLAAEDKQKYQTQHTLVKKIVAVFERPDYSDENTEMSKEVLTLMNEMQELGSPPADILGEMPPGLDFNAEGMPKLSDTENCVIA